MKTYLKAWKQYALFRGRSTRAEYWTFALVNFAIGIVLMGPTYAALFTALAHHQPPPETTQSMVMGLVYDVFVLAQLIPSFAVQVRRLHDLDRSGWWLLIVLLPIVGWLLLFVWFCLRGTDGPNRFGDDPLADEEPPALTPTL